ncbi:MAG: hypothetical protein ABSC23_04655 [Bryobacteraceae bacterium]|jgi:hypothetical protein
MTRYLIVRIQLWVVAVVATLALIGVIVSINILTDGMSYEGAKAAIAVGLIVWVLSGLSIWTYRAMVASSSPDSDNRPPVDIHLERALPAGG